MGTAVYARYVHTAVSYHTWNKLAADGGMHACMLTTVRERYDIGVAVECRAPRYPLREVNL